MRIHRGAVLAFLVGGLALATQPAAAQPADLMKLTIEDLLNTEITSVARKEQPLSRTAAAVHVVTQEDIRRSGARTIPDLLRMVPGFAVAQIDAGTWAVTSRGFNGIHANKLLVLIDGRSVYTPLFAGVHWDMENVRLQDIERIEVIRGPGGSLWGANAVNGVVNIITKKADATQGGEVIAGGSAVGARGEVRYGGRAGEAFYRIFGKHAARSSGGSIAGFADPDDHEVTLGGFRIDWLGDLNEVALHGAVQHGDGRHVRTRSLLEAPWRTIDTAGSEFDNGNLVFSWNRALSSRADVALQTSYQAYTRTASELNEQWQIFDVDARQRRRIGRRHEVNGGFGYRFWSNTVRNTPTVAFNPARERSHVVTAFVQDEVEVTKSVHVAVGSKFEHNPYSGFEAQPNVRATWVPTRHHALWASTSRAVRTPSKSDRGLEVVAGVSPRANGGLMLITVEGSPDVQSETLRAVEAGYRFQTTRASFDFTAFRNKYDRLKTSEPGAMTTGVYGGRRVLHLPIRFANLAEASAGGAEVSASWQPLDRWKMTGAYSHFHLAVNTLPGSRDTGVAKDGAVPEQQASFRSYLDVTRRLSASVLVYRVGALTPLDVPAYTKLDAAVTWKLAQAELITGIANLLGGGRIEMVEVTGIQSAPARRAAYLEVKWQF